MPEKIGKYEVLERIGHGGMGTIFKAHDPVLDRPVALKVISSEVEITDELRTRFFREAKACARLSHPNIVTLYDMGEAEGRLFIVMELLEGEELRRLITQPKALALEDKLAIMVQVCDGLHYAHQKGIVHRDIKPGNIFRLRNGQVKILDFGIAQIANSVGGLTRTGLIMGTLRYVSPEQVRGRADHRSDIFSVGAVFYEFLSSRPPFTGEDPMQILEQLRTEDPPPLGELDPTIPPELAAIVSRAMRKDPGERFPDLEQMRSELEQVKRGLAEEAQRVRVRLRDQREQLRELRATLAERIGPSGEEAAVPAIDEGGRLAALQAAERDVAGQIETLRAKITRADALTPAFERGTELLQAEEFADAVAEFEAIVVDMPEHARAVEALGQVRARAEAQRRRQLATQLVRHARTALDEGGYSLCLEILKQAAEIPPPAEVAHEIASLRETAEAALAAQEAARRARLLVERTREQMVRVQYTAQAQAAPQYAPALWKEAEALGAEAQAAFVHEAYGEAGQAFEAAATAYRRCEEAAREAQLREREAAARAREQMAQGRERARAAGAPEHARELWDAAEVKATEAEGAFAEKALGRAVLVFDEASVLYDGAAGAAHDTRQRERRSAQGARVRATEGERAAAAADAQRYASSLWNEACARSTEAQSALAKEQFAKAAEAFDGALILFRQAESHAREARRHQRDHAEEARRAMMERRRDALAGNAASHARSEWNEAEASVASGEVAFAQEAYAEASQAFDQGAALYRRAEGRAREVVRELEIARADAEKGREGAALARGAAAEANASKYASEQWRAGESAEAQAVATMGRREYAAAHPLFVEARRQYAAAAQAAGVAAEAESRRADAMMGDARRLLESGDVAACLSRLSEILALKPDHAAAEGLRLQAEEKLRWADAATRQGVAPVPGPRTETIETPAVLAAPTAPGEAPPPESPTRVVETVSDDATVLIGAATHSDAVRISPAAPGIGDAGSTHTWARDVAPATNKSRWRRVGMAVVGGLAAIGLGILLWLSRTPPPGSPPAVPVPAARAQRDAAPAAQKRQQSEAERARERMTEARIAAEQSDAARYAQEILGSGQLKERDATTALERSDYGLATRLFGEARSEYETAEQEAKRQTEVEQRQVAALKSSADQWRGRMLTRRDEAVRAGADRLAKDLFAAGQAKLAEADRLAARQNFAPAIRAYQDAASRYVEATLWAHAGLDARSQADSARVRMQAEKQRANQAAPEFSAALAEERQADSLYERLAYKDAAEKFRWAETLFARAAAKTPASTPSAPSRPSRPRRIPLPF